VQLTEEIVAGARLLQISFLDHVIVGQAMAGRRGYFSFQEAGLL
jgi:DNA repair protein RadC